MNIVSFGGGTNSTAMIIGMYSRRAFCFCFLCTGKLLPPQTRMEGQADSLR